MDPQEIKPDIDELERDAVHDELKPAVVHDHFYAFQDHADIWARIVAVLEDDKAYRTVSHLAVQCKHLAAVVQPALKKIEKRVVLDLDDLQRTPESKWGDIEQVFPVSRIITCNELSALPFGAFWPDHQVQRRIDTIKQKLTPRIIAFRGHSHPSVVSLCKFFPKAHILRIMEESTHPVLRNIGPLDLDSRLALFPPHYFVDACNEVAECVASVRRNGPVELRYVSHEMYQATLCDSRPGQQWLSLRATSAAGLVLQRQSLDVFLDDDFQDETLRNLEESTILPTTSKWESIEINYYIQLYHTTPGPLFATSRTDDHPQGYHHLSRTIDDLASRHLDRSRPRSRLTFRFFVVRHTEWLDRARMEPVYQTVVQWQGATEGQRATRGALEVVERMVDREFVMCVVEGGCGRCRR